MSRLVFAAALIAGISFDVIPRTPDATWWIVWKASGVALLALWTALPARDANGRLLVGVLAFPIGHLLALALYLGNRRSQRGMSLAATIVAAVAIGGAAFGLTHGYGVGLYALGLGAMTGSALASRFPLAGVGAGLFAFSDLMIFAKVGPLAGSPPPGLMIWPAYFAGQTLIAIGVVRGLRRPHAATI